MFQRFFVFTLFVFLLPIPATAQNPEDIPPTLRPWIKWVEAELPELNCPNVNGVRVCQWPGTLRVQVNSKEATFSLNGYLDEDGEILIPGATGIWPQDLFVNGKKALVGKRANAPIVLLKKGSFSLVGKFSWKKIPETLPLPENIGRVFLTVGGEKVPSPRINAEGQLFLKEGDAEALKETDTLRVSIFRKINDGIPLSVENRFELNVSGRGREVDLGSVLFGASVPLKIDTPLPLRIDKGAVKIFVRPGKHIVNIHTIIPTPPKRLITPTKAASIFDKQEVWVWVPNDRVQSVELSGLTSVDSNRTSLPDEWKDKTTFLAESGNALALKMTRRGMVETAPNSIQLHREIWLDLDGTGYTIRDNINGEMKREWRLDYQDVDGANLGRVNRANDGLLITKNKTTSLSGVELRESKIDLSAEVRLKDARNSFNVVGWDHDVKRLSARLHLPPGWSVFHGQGVDRISNTWMSSWTLWDLFFVFMIMLGFFQLFGWKWAMVSMLTLLLTHGHPEAPEWSWIILILTLALLRVLPNGIWRKGLIIIRSIVFLVFLTILALYANDQVMSALFPQVRAKSINFNPIGGMEKSFVQEESALERVSRSDQYVNEVLSELKSEKPKISKKNSWSGKRNKMQQIDPNAVVQTGPGLPNWSWKSWNLEWTGPVQKDQQVTLWLVSSWVNRVLSFLRIIFLFLLAFVILALHDMRWFGTKKAAVKNEERAVKKTVISIVILIWILFVSGSAFAKKPPVQIEQKIVEEQTLEQTISHPVEPQTISKPGLLNALKSRLEKSAQCPSPCIVLSKSEIGINDLTFQMEVEVSALKDSGFKLPGPSDRLILETIELNGEATNQIRKEDGLTLVRIPKGTHVLRVRGTLAARDVLTLQFDESALAEFTRFKSEDWTVDGLSYRGTTDASLQLTRLNKSKTKDESESDSELPPWFTVKRNFSIGLPWTIETEITRMDSTRPQLLKLPLLKNERLISDGFRMETSDGTTMVAVELPRGQKTIRFVSELSIQPTIKLAAATDQPWTEQWSVTCSRIWRCGFNKSIAPIDHIKNGISSPSFFPWPGEQLEIQINRPEGVSGASSTVTNVNYTVTPGNRLLLANLSMKVRASQGGWQKITIPDGAELQKVNIDNNTVSIRPVGNVVTVPLKPGAQNIVLEWQQSWERKAFETAPPVDIGSDAVNVKTSISRGDDRWVLWAMGSPWGPAVLFWPRLLIMLLIAFGIGRIKGLPVKTYEWMILVIGLSQLPPIALIPIVFWFLVIRWRNESPLENPSMFNLAQLAIPFITIVALGVLYAAIHTNLLINIDMQVKGANSTNRIFRWYVDRSTSALPQPTILTISDWFWRIAMLLWAVWLVVRLYKWAPWAWGSFTTGGIWKSFSKKAIIPGPRPNVRIQNHESEE